MIRKFNLGICSPYFISKFPIQTPIENFQYEIIKDGLDEKREKHLFSISKFKTISGIVKVFDLTDLKLSEFNQEIKKENLMLKRTNNFIEKTDLLIYNIAEENNKEIEYLKQLKSIVLGIDLSNGKNDYREYEKIGYAIKVPKDKDNLKYFLTWPGVLSAIKKRNFEEINNRINSFNKTRYNNNKLIQTTPYLEELLLN